MASTAACACVQDNLLWHATSETLIDNSREEVRSAGEHGMAHNNWYLDYIRLAERLEIQNKPGGISHLFQTHAPR